MGALYSPNRTGRSSRLAIDGAESQFKPNPRAADEPALLSFNKISLQDTRWEVREVERGENIEGGPFVLL